MATTHPTVLKTRSKAPYALVKVYREPATVEHGELIPGAVTGVEIVGYAHSTGRGVPRAGKLGALLLPIVEGKVEVSV